jgi:Uma2 family endonuclease
MATMLESEPQTLLPKLPPTQDELPYSDGVPMESERHYKQVWLLIETLKLHWKDRSEGYVGGNMFVYFSLEQVKNQDFRGPDFFAVLETPKRERKSWVVWEEGGRGPDVVIELLSESTAALDRGEKKQIYQNQLKVPEYFWYDPFSGELEGFRMSVGGYRPIPPDEVGRLHSEKLGLWLTRAEGTFQDCEAPWLRWMTEDGVLLPTSEEQAQTAQQQAQAAQQQAASERALREQAEDRIRQLEAQLGSRLAAGHEEAGS